MARYGIGSDSSKSSSTNSGRSSRRGSVVTAIQIGNNATGLEQPFNNMNLEPGVNERMRGSVAPSIASPRSSVPSSPSFSDPMVQSNTSVGSLLGKFQNAQITTPEEAQMAREQYVAELAAAIKGQSSRSRRGGGNSKKYAEALRAAYEKQMRQFMMNDYYHNLAFSRSITHDAVNTQTHTIRYG
jgi:hypothetical protein